MITGSDLYSQAWVVTYSVISGNVTDPVSRGGSQWIFADYPQIQEGNTKQHPGFPIITIDPFQDDSMNLTNTQSENSIMSTISVHTNNKRQLDTVSSDVFNALNSHRVLFLQSGMKSLTITPEGISTDFYARDKKIHMKDIGIGFKVHL